jgi:3-deoxy-D-manno-octulosonic-acid transferase
VLASARDGEERHLLAALNSAGATGKGSVQWLIVPRHPQRFDEVAALIEAQGWRCLRCSVWPDGAPPAASTNTMWLGDSMGEMSWYYALSDVALMGGSFQPLGGQNLIEACAVGCPVVLGPSTFNFAEPAQAAIDAGAAVQVSELAAAVQQALCWCVSDRAARDAAATAATALCAAHRGATQRTVAAVARLLQSTQRT